MMMLMLMLMLLMMMMMMMMMMMIRRGGRRSSDAQTAAIKRVADGGIRHLLVKLRHDVAQLGKDGAAVLDEVTFLAVAVAHVYPDRLTPLVHARLPIGTPVVTPGRHRLHGATVMVE